jgi:excisionase family DNA binding protein
MTRIAFSEDEASESAGIGKTKLREEIAEGRLVARRVGARVIIAAEDLQTWLSNLPRVRAAAS